MTHRTEHEAAQTSLHSHRILLPTGITMHYVSKGRMPKTNARVERAIVLLHGWSDSWRSFEEMLAWLPFDATPVFALDLRGHGATSASAIHAYTLRDLAADIAAFLDVRGIEKAVLVGHSLGGLLTHQVAVEYPERVDSLVLISSGATMAGHPLLAEMRPDIETFADDAPAPIEFITEFQISTFCQTPPPHVLYRYVAESLRVQGIVWKELLESKNREDHRALLPLLDIPALILWGEEDPIFPRAAQDELLDLLPNARMMTFPEAGHALNVERAQAVVEMLEAFVSETAPVAIVHP